MITVKRTANIKPSVTVNTLSDKQLLQLAAQALDIYIDFAGYTAGDGPWREGNEEWNPLKDNDDAFCLMTDLHINLDARSTKVRAFHDELPLDIDLYFDYKDDKRAATRRAIVVCATSLART